MFARYARKLAETLGNDATFWITINEPEIYALNGYLRGVWPPQKKGIINFYRCIANLIRAHRRAYAAIKKIVPQAQVGAALNMSYLESAGGIVNNTLGFFARRVWNEHFLRHTARMCDFIGLNYYFRNRVHYGFNKNVDPKFAQRKSKVSDMGWELYPQGIEFVLRELAQFKKPIYVTENGLADAEDKNRLWLIEETLEAIARAMQSGSDVRGYFHWSLLDNFEWDKGFWPRFGLIEVDYKTQKRTVRQSAKEYAKLIKEYSS